MFNLKKILFPVDFSERSKGAAHFVEALAGRFDAELTLLHVVESADYLYGTLEFGGTAFTDYRVERLEKSRAQLDAWLADEMRYFNVRRVLAEGDPARKIIEAAHGEKFDLIAMPSHGFGPFRRFIIGSVTAKVLHDAHIPVWTGVHMEQAPPLEAITCNEILCAVDLGPQSEHALNWAAGLAKEYEAGLAVVHATPCVEASPARHVDTELASAFLEKARQELTKLLAASRVKAEIVVEAGDPAAVVRYAAEQREADMLVIARGSAAGGFGRLRTHAYSIIRQSPCPVVSV